MRHWLLCLTAAATLGLATGPALAQTGYNASMLELATHSGCMVCHAMRSPRPDSELLAPTYQQIAARYQDDSAAFDRLVDRVLHGTVYREQAWAEHVNMRFMPPNVNLAPQDVRALVHWILSLRPEAVDEQAVRHERMMALAARSGCFACHDMRREADSRYVPLAPPFHDVAKRYGDSNEVKAQLLAAVRQGTMDQPKKWDDVNMRFMPPSVALEDTNARMLVDWILSLE